MHFNLVHAKKRFFFALNYIKFPSNYKAKILSNKKCEDLINILWLVYYLWNNGTFANVFWKWIGKGRVGLSRGSLDLWEVGKLPLTSPRRHWLVLMYYNKVDLNSGGCHIPRLSSMETKLILLYTSNDLEISWDKECPTLPCDLFW